MILILLNKKGLQQNNSVLVVEQNNYATKIFAIRYAQQFYIKKLFFGATNKVKIIVKVSIYIVTI